MQCLIAKELVDPTLLIVRPMNFGQPAQGLVALAYQLTLSLADLSLAFQQLYRDWQADGERHPDPDDDLERALREAEWPALAELGQARPTLLARLLLRLGYDLLLDLERTWATPQAPAFCINTLDHVAVDGAQIVLAGQAYRYEARSDEHPNVDL